MKTTTRSLVRKAFKDIGYRVFFKRNPFNDNLTIITFTPAKPSNVLRPIETNGCFSVDFYNEHREAFKLAESFNGYFLTCTEQKII